LAQGEENEDAQQSRQKTAGSRRSGPGVEDISDNILLEFQLRNEKILFFEFIFGKRLAKLVKTARF
jgi:hypothetical protein